MNLKAVHHIAIICSDYEKSKKFYTEILGFRLEHEYYRKERDSYKADLSLNGTYIIELFSFPSPPKRLSYPEATGLRHLAFEVEDVDIAEKELSRKNIFHEQIRTDEFTGKRFIFLFDPDDLPLELYER